MDLLEAIKDTITNTESSNAENLSDNSKQIDNINLEDRLSPTPNESDKDISRPVDLEKNTNFYGSILKDTNNQEHAIVDNLDNTSRLTEVPTLPSKDENIFSRNTDVLQGSLLNYATDSQTSENNKMNIDDDDNKSNDPIILSENSVNSIKDDCLPEETDTTNLNIEVQDSESDNPEDSKESSQFENEVMETEENVITTVEETLKKSEDKGIDKLNLDEVVSDTTGKEKMSIENEVRSHSEGSDSDERPVVVVGTGSDSIEMDQSEIVAEQITPAKHFVEHNNSCIEVEQITKDPVGTEKKEESPKEDLHASKEISAQNQVIEIEDEIENTKDDFSKFRDDVQNLSNDITEIESDSDDIEDDVEEIKHSPFFLNKSNKIQDNVEPIQNVQEIRDDVEKMQDDEDVKEIHDDVEEVKTYVEKVQSKEKIDDGVDLEKEENAVETVTDDAGEKQEDLRNKFEEVHCETRKNEDDEKTQNVEVVQTNKELKENVKDSPLDTRETKEIEHTETSSETEEVQTQPNAVRSVLQECTPKSEEILSVLEETELEKMQVEPEEMSSNPEEIQGDQKKMQDELEETAPKLDKMQIEPEVMLPAPDEMQTGSAETQTESEEKQLDTESRAESQEIIAESIETEMQTEERRIESKTYVERIKPIQSVIETSNESEDLQTERLHLPVEADETQQESMGTCAESEETRTEPEESISDSQCGKDATKAQETSKDATEPIESISQLRAINTESDTILETSEENNQQENIETENRSDSESDVTDVESVEDENILIVEEKGGKISFESEVEKAADKSDSTSIDKEVVESTNTSQQELDRDYVEEKDDTKKDEPSSDTESKSIGKDQEPEEVDNRSIDSGTDNSVPIVDLESNTASSKDDDNSQDVIVTSDEFVDRTVTSADENAKESYESINNEEAEISIANSNNIDQVNCEDSSESNPIFVHIDPEIEKGTAHDKNSQRMLLDNQEEDFQESQPQEDPIASDVAMEDDDDLDQQADEQGDVEQGASEEMCIIPDTERVISQAERDAIAGMVPLSDPTETESFSSDPSSDGISGETSSDKRKGSNPENYVITLCTDENVNACMQCCLPRKSKYSVLHNKVVSYVCDDGCLNNFKRRRGDKVIMNAEGDLRVKKLTSGVNNDNMVAKVKFRRKCSECEKKLTINESNLSWETMEFCNELCLSKYQKKVASNCSNCQAAVRNNCLGKYCVRFGYDIRQFCSSTCLEEYKKGLKVCSYCQKDMSGGGDGFLAPVGDKGQFKDFCTQLCMEKYDIMSNNRRPVCKPGTICSVCLKEKPITIEFDYSSKLNLFCGEPCFVAFKFVNNITPAKCNMCKKYFDNKILEEHSMFYDNALHSFCSKSCQNIYIIGHRKIVPCSWCKVKKYNFDMIKRSASAGSSLLMCSLNCLSLYQVSVNAVQSKKTKCDHCQKTLQPLYHLTMSDATMRNFCSYPCVMAFQNQFPKTPISLHEPDESSTPVPTGGPKRSKRTATAKSPETTPAEVPTIPVISSVQSLATSNGPTAETLKTTKSKSTSDSSSSATSSVVKTHIRQQFIIKPVPLPSQRNIGTLCKVNTQTKGVSCKANTCNKDVQTDEVQDKTALIPIPVPIYVPAPMWMYSMPFPVPFPFPLPVPVPIFIPTTRNSATGIMKEIKKIQVKIPTDPFEAELLMMAEMVAGDKKEEHTDSESEEEDAPPPPDETTFSPEPVDASNTFGDDMLQMALKMATELDEPAVDLEGALTANTITASQGSEPPGINSEQLVSVEEPHEETTPIHHIVERQSGRGRKRPGRPPKAGGTVSKRGRRSSNQMDLPIMAPPQQPPPPSEPVEKPDANMCLKYTFGVNAWKQWVTTKNAELEKTSRRVKLFKPEILQLTADELNYSLCLFVKEVRKPNGQEYAPDTIYYLCLGIQQYLFENARIDNIFCDSYYEKFTDCLDEVAKKFSILYNDSHYIVTRVEEEHLWESKQLGAHSPHVLLSTLMFFNTKHFNLTTVDEHMQLSFSHIMKHWKRNSHSQPGTAKMAGSRNVLLRFYPPQSNNADTAQRKKKVYEQQENEDNPLRCPVKLYEFYLSKCPESVKTRNDVFYLLPERSCVPDSPVWYSTMPLPKAALEKMLHRVKMVKEINVALLTS